MGRAFPWVRPARSSRGADCRDPDLHFRGARDGAREALLAAGVRRPPGSVMLKAALGDVEST